MNIAHILPASVLFPLNSHNGRYQWVLQLASLQSQNGHDVTVYCNQDSRIENVQTRGIHFTTDDKQHNNRDTFRLALQADHDIYHSHFDNLHYEMSKETTKQIVYTQHWWPTENTIQSAQKALSKNVWAVPPTNFMYECDTELGIQSKGAIYHGIDLDLFHPLPVPPTGRLLFVSRISPEKNLGIAISAAKRTGIGLDIIGKFAPKNQEYWQNLQTLIDGEHIRYLGSKSHNELVEYYTSASALLFPSDINEPFGLVAIESQACGTPVIMKRGGSRAELLEEGKTGFLCETEADFIAAIGRVNKIRPIDCVDFAQKFDVKIMARQYDKLYSSLIAS